MSELPKGWIEAPIGNLCSLENGRAFKPTDWVQSGLPIVRIQNLNNPNASFNYFDKEVDQRYFLRGGELLFAWSGTPGTSFGTHIWYGKEAVLNQHIFRVDFNEDLIDKRFFCFAINQKLTELIGIAHGGVGLRHVTKGKFQGTEILIAPLNEQKRIADKLDRLLAKVDNCRERLDRIPLILKHFRQSVLMAATSGKLTENGLTTTQISSTEIDFDSLPSDWNILTLTDIAKVIDPNPKHRNPKYFQSGFPFLSTAQFGEHDNWDLTQIKYVSEETVLEQELRCEFYPGSLVFSRKGTIGKVRQIPTGFRFALLDSVCIINLNNNRNSDYLKIAIESDFVQKQISELTRGVALKQVSVGDVRSLQIPLPPSEQQQEIVRRVEKLFDFADRLEARYKKARAKIDKLTPALLDKAFKGELVPQDPTDEPAAVLLQKIQNVSKPQKTKAISKKKS
jgi:type I restriction enzyme, S subunit